VREEIYPCGVLTTAEACLIFLHRALVRRAIEKRRSDVGCCDTASLRAEQKAQTILSSLLSLFDCDPRMGLAAFPPEVKDSDR
jgi:hypothetical protein